LEATAATRSSFAGVKGSGYTFLDLPLKREYGMVLEFLQFSGASDLLPLLK